MKREHIKYLELILKLRKEAENIGDNKMVKILTKRFDDSVVNYTLQMMKTV